MPRVDIAQGSGRTLRGAEDGERLLFGKDEAKPVLRKSRPREDEQKCSVPGCSEAVTRSQPMKKVQKALPDVAGSGKRAYLCRTHYKEYRKKTKDDREAERLGW